MTAENILDHPGSLEIDRLNRFCIDQTFLNEMVTPLNIQWEQHILEYVLETGANWSGPIKNFRLVIDKGSSDNLVSFCAQDIHKISATQFEVRASNFTPTSNLSVLILTRALPEPVEPPNVPPNLHGQANVASLNCDQLWHQRNSIFKSAGYCFHTLRAISVFGNAGCAYDEQRNLPLSDRDRQAITAIQQLERSKRCLQ
jgi:hypothetical protein